MIHSKEINACFRNHLISSSFIISGHPFRMLFAVLILCLLLPFKMRCSMAFRSTSFFAEIMYNDNSNSYTSNNSNKVDTIRIMHNSNSNSNSNRGNINRIVRMSSNLSINAIMRITSGCSWMPTNCI